MLLLIDASRANNDQKTGVEWYAFFVIQELKKIIPNNVNVILYTRETLRGHLSELPKNWQEKILKWPPRRLWTQIRLAWEMLKYRGRQDVVLFVPAHVLPLVTPPNTFTTIHDLGGFSFPKGYSLFEKWYTKFAVRQALKRASIFVPSNFIKKEIEYFFSTKVIDNIKITVVHNGYDAESFKSSFDESKLTKILKKYNVQRPYFLSVSRLEEKKNTLGIIKGFEIFKELLDTKCNPPAGGLDTSYSLVLLGKPGYGYEKIISAINKSPYCQNIILPGWIVGEDLPTLLKAAEVFVFPSFYEGFGIPVLESFAVGTPVVTSNLASLPEVANGAALLVNPCKPVEIAEALINLTVNPAIKENLKNKGLERASEFNWRKTAGEIWRALSRV